MKGIIKLGWKEYVLDLEDAMELLTKVKSAERFEEYTNRKTKEVTYHVWEEGAESVRMNLDTITDQGYRVAKLLGQSKES
tara:strand:- start:4789 stop:5028 length:240 start_codon:yes stop_codon:yes gene_type:complete